MIVDDITEPFVPLADMLLVNLMDAKEMIRMLLKSIPEMFAGSTNSQSCLGAALLAAKLLMPSGGRISVFQASLPNHGPGAITRQEDSSLKCDLRACGPFFVSVMIAEAHRRSSHSLSSRQTFTNCFRLVEISPMFF